MPPRKSNGSAAAAVGPAASDDGEAAIDINAVIRAHFEDIYKANQRIAAAMEKHIDPLRKTRLKLLRDLKTITGINRKALDAEYALFVIAKEAMDLEDEDHRDKVLDDLRMLHESLHPGGQADWVAALELSQQTEMPKLPK